MNVLLYIDYVCLLAQWHSSSIRPTLPLTHTDEHKHTHLAVLEHSVQILMVRVLSVISTSTSVTPEIQTKGNTIGGMHTIEGNQSEPCKWPKLHKRHKLEIKRLRQWTGGALQGAESSLWSERLNTAAGHSARQGETWVIFTCNSEVVLLHFVWVGLTYSLKTYLNVFTWFSGS